MEINKQGKVNYQLITLSKTAKGRGTQELPVTEKDTEEDKSIVLYQRPDADRMYSAPPLITFYYSSAARFFLLSSVLFVAASTHLLSFCFNSCPSQSLP